MEASRNTAFDANRERLMLRYQLDVLEKFEKDHEYEIIDVVDECRMLRYKIECIQGALLSQNLTEDVSSIYKNQQSTPPDGFAEWIQQRTGDSSHDTNGGLIIPPASLCCPYRSCINYVYGFNRLESLREHLKGHNPPYDQPVGDVPLNSVINEPIPKDEAPDDEVEDQEFTYVSFDPLSSSRKREGDYLHHRVKRVMDKANMKLVKDQGACLRCRILKKKCDDRTPCTHCPPQDSTTEGDHWKVLGCHRSSLRDLSKLLLPGHPNESENLDRPSSICEGGIDLRSETSAHASRSSVARLPPRWPSGGTESNVRRLPTLASLPADPKFTQNWSYAAKGLFMVAESNKELEVSTAYSSIDLMRNSRRICEDLQWQNDHKTELDLAHVIVSEAVKFLVAQKGLQGQHSKSSNDDQVPDNKNLRNFLGAFSDSCSRRTSLSAQSWIELFHALCLFSIYKTILIDAYALRSENGHPRIWKHSDAIVIDSVYRTLVSIFTWASGVKDPMICEDVDLEDAGILEALKGTRELVKQSQWKQRGIKSSKDFLMSLGSCLFEDGPFNGFVLQNYRLDRKLQQTQKPRRGGERLTLEGSSDNEYHLRPSRPPPDKNQSSQTNIIPRTTPNQTAPSNTETPTTAKTAVDVTQWLDTISSGVNRNVFGYVPLHGRGHGPAPNAESLGGTHTESWLENNQEREIRELPACLEMTGAPFSLIFDPEE